MSGLAEQCSGWLERDGDARVRYRHAGTRDAADHNGTCGRDSVPCRSVEHRSGRSVHRWCDCRGVGRGFRIGGDRMARTCTALIAGIIAGAIWAALAAWLRSRFGVLEVISTIMLNFIATYGASFLVRGPLQEPTHVYPQTSGIASGAHMPILVSGTRLHWGFIVALVVAVMAWWVMKYSATG